MTADTSAVTADRLQDPRDLSIVLGGPFYQLLRRSHLSGEALERLRRRLIVLPLVAWLPLLVLSALEGQALGGRAAVPFLLDVDVQIQLLVVVPLFLAAERTVFLGVRPVVRDFRGRALIPERARGRFEAAVASAGRLGHSIVAEVVLLAFVYVVGVLILWRHYGALATATWYGAPTAAGLRLSLAGTWYGYVSVPLYQFLLIRWYFRLFIWARFLWQVSRIDLGLVPTHPDRAGGLGFLANTVYGFIPLAMAHGAMLAGQIANRILYLGAALPDFTVEIAVLVGFVMTVVLAPFLVFAPQLVRAKLLANREYGALAERYVREFEAKWLRGGAPRDAPLVGSADIQSLADLANSFEVARTMRFTPVTTGAILQLAAAVLAPLVPLAFTMISPEELMRLLFGVLF